MVNLPKKLNKAPLIEVVFEMRFQSEVWASSVLSGIFFTKNNKGIKIEKLPVSDIPQQIRDFDPILRYAPQLRMTFENYAFLIGDRVFAIANLPPYTGWIDFKEKVSDAVNIIKQSSIISEVERYSLKYVNLIEAPSKEQLKCIKLNLRLGSHQIESEAVNVRVEIPENDFINIVQIISHGIVSEKEGVIINIDSIANGPHSNFWSKLSDDLERSHDITKKLFFDFLQEETIEKLEPVYDK